MSCLMYIAATKQQGRYGTTWWQNILLKMWGNKNLSLENFTNRKWLMTKTSKAQTNKYHRFLEDMKTENINLFEAFIARILI